MASNTFGTLFSLTTFGESHGKAIGGIIDGCPAGLSLDMDFIQSELNRRRPGQSHIVTQRNESDTVEFLSGISDGKTTGTPIGFMIQNQNQKTKDYEHIENMYRPSHADYTYDAKYGHRDAAGGGRSSARETANWVVAGAIAKLILKKHNVLISAYTSQVGSIVLNKNYKDLDLSTVDSNIVRCPSETTANQMIQLIEQIRKEGDTIGGVISCVVQQVPVGLGDPVFEKLHANLGKAMFTINAVKGVEFGTGFQAASMKGSEHNDSLIINDKTNDIAFKTNHSGGILGGISNGDDIYFRVAFKPVATIIQKQSTINSKGEAVEMMGKGRHDPCVVPRAVPIVEAMTAMVLVEHLFRNKFSKMN